MELSPLFILPCNKIGVSQTGILIWRLVLFENREVISMQWLKRAENKNLKITNVGALDGDSFGITLESGHTILLELGDRIGEPAFAALIKSGDFCKPYTDGKQLYWPGGVSLTLEEILDMLLSQCNNAQQCTAKPRPLQGGRHEWMKQVWK